MGRGNRTIDETEADDEDPGERGDQAWFHRRGGRGHRRGVAASRSGCQPPPAGRGDERRRVRRGHPWQRRVRGPLAEPDADVDRGTPRGVGGAARVAVLRRPARGSAQAVGGTRRRRPVCVPSSVPENIACSRAGSFVRTSAWGNARSSACSGPPTATSDRCPRSRSGPPRSQPSSCPSPPLLRRPDARVPRRRSLSGAAAVVDPGVRATRRGGRPARGNRRDGRSRPRCCRGGSARCHCDHDCRSRSRLRPRRRPRQGSRRRHRRPR